MSTLGSRRHAGSGACRSSTLANREDREGAGQRQASHRPSQERRYRPEGADAADGNEQRAGTARHAGRPGYSDGRPS